MIKKLEETVAEIRALKDSGTTQTLFIKPTHLVVYDDELHFTKFGNGRRGFTRRQLEDDIVAARFYNQFKDLFVRDLITDSVYWDYPREETTL